MADVLVLRHVLPERLFPIAFGRFALFAWPGLVVVGAGAVTSLLLCYLRR